ncbi:MAG: V-type ATP synthase subunit D [Myxococcota bacterium]
MATLGLTKSSLQREKARLMAFEKALPALDLKRQKLLAAKSVADRALEESRSELTGLRREVPAQLPMLANRGIDLTDLVVVHEVFVGRQNVVGVLIPSWDGARIESRVYSFLVRPHWVDRVADLLARCAELSLRTEVEKRRVDLLEEARRRITQRVNLFEKVLIPRTRSNIRRIQVHLGDAERAAVVRAKVAQRKRRRASA